MADNTVITDPKAPASPPDPTQALKDQPIGQEVRKKSFEQLIREDRSERQKSTKADDGAPQHTDEEKAKAEEERLAKEATDAKQQIESEEAEKKRQAELATKAADEAIAKLKKEEQDKLDAVKKEEDEKKRKEDLKPKFTGVDKDGNVVPKDYDEITKESVRIAKEETRAEILAELAAKEEVRAKEIADKAQTETEQKAAQKTFEDTLQKELDIDLQDLYANNKLPKIKDPNNENDEGNKEFKNLFETAQRVNAERMAKGEPPIRSIKLIYYEHYKPLAKPAGHDAPVMGSESTLSQEAPDDKYIPSRDRHKSMGQLIKEERIRLSRKLNIRNA